MYKGESTSYSCHLTLIFLNNNLVARLKLVIYTKLKLTVHSIVRRPGGI